MPCDLRRVLAFGQKLAVPVIEDAACAIGSEILWEGRWEKIGKPHGDIACFSFHPRKLVTTGDGGMITTGNPEWDSRFRLWRQHGMSVPDTARHGSASVVFEDYPVLGYNYRLTDIQGAIGREQLRRLPAMIERRHLLAARYRSLLASIPGLGLPFEPEWARSNWQSYCVRLPAGFDQRRVMEAMLAKGVATRRGIQNAHREPAYRQEPWRSACGPAPACRGSAICPCLNESETAQDRCILLPLYHELTDAAQDRVASALADALR